MMQNRDDPRWQNAPTPGTTAPFCKLAICTERRARVINAFIGLANAAIVTRRPLAEAWTTDNRWDDRPARRP
ncbi:hypothetical protein E1285_15125 [Actinomadura sp. 7K507]|nr:hypothetical protein E1285_15125 [Actinomadura sp. 7K507]